VSDVAEVKAVLRSVLEDRLENANISDIIVRRDLDHDGDEIFDVMVVIDSKRLNLDPNRTTGVVRHLRPKLAEIGETAFPILTYVLKSSLKKSPPEAA